MTSFVELGISSVYKTIANHNLTLIQKYLHQNLI